MRLIYSYHDEDPTSETNLTYHGLHRGAKSVSLLSASLPPPVYASDDIKIIDLRNRNVRKRYFFLSFFLSFIYFSFFLSVSPSFVFLSLFFSFFLSFLCFIHSFIHYLFIYLFILFYFILFYFIYLKCMLTDHKYHHNVFDCI